MNKNIKIILITILIVGLLVVLTLLSSRQSSVHVNDESVTGNTASNLLNNGLFCEYDDMVYFANPMDDGALYSMTSDETNVKKILSSSVKSINCDGKRIYYAQSGKSSGKGLGYMRKSTGMYSCTLKGGKSIAYTLEPVGIMSLCGNSIIYQKYVEGIGTTLYAMNIDKSGDKELVNQFVNPSSLYYSTLYYSGADKDHYLYNLDLNTMTETCMWEHNMYNPVYHTDGWVYFIDLRTNYELHRYSPNSGEEEVLATDRIDFFNVIGNVIYYQVSTGSSPALKRVLTDGSAGDTVANGVYSNINTTSKYLYFTEFDDSAVMYHAYHSNPSAYTLFTPDVK